MTRRKCPLGCPCGRHSKEAHEKKAAKIRGRKYPCMPGCICGKHSPESHERKAAAIRGVKRPEQSARTIRTWTGRKHSEESKKKMSLHSFHYKCPEGCNCKRHSLDSKERGKNLAIYIRRFRGPTYIEKVLAENAAIMYGPDLIEIQHPILSFLVDVAIPSLHIVLEADGEYWHQNKARDKRRQDLIEEQGWNVFRFTGSQLNRWNKIYA